MKLPIKKEYFDKIKLGDKKTEFRDAHITFVCEETGETMRKNVKSVYCRKGLKEYHPDVLEDDLTIVFDLE